MARSSDVEMASGKSASAPPPREAMRATRRPLLLVARCVAEQHAGGTCLARPSGKHEEQHAGGRSAAAVSSDCGAARPRVAMGSASP